jgi:DNA-binding NarL/FixJ family response regulator
MQLIRKTVMIVDPSPIFRRQLKATIQTNETLVDVIEADTIKAAENSLSSAQIDVVFLDIAFPQDGGFDLIDTIKGVAPDIRIVVLTDHDSAAHQATALEKGAAYFLSKADAGGLRLIDVIHETIRRA